MQIQVLKTYEIKYDQWVDIVNNFNKIFHHQKDLKTFKGYYEKTCKGFSYHALAFNDNGKLAGYNSVMPFLYSGGKDKYILIGLSGGTFVVPEYRNDIFIFADMINALLDNCSKEGMVAVLGVPNTNSFQYAIKFLKSTLISYIPYYGLPMRFFNIIKKRELSYFNFFSVIFSNFLLFINLIISKFFNGVEKSVRFEIITDEQFFKNRFGRAEYKEIVTDSIKSYYRSVIEESIRVVYLFDFREKNRRTYKALVKSLGYIMKVEKPDIILFIGHLRLIQFILFRIPWKYEPQHLPLTFNLTSDYYSYYFNEMSKEGNWNFGLMNFDAR